MNSKRTSIIAVSLAVLLGALFIIPRFTDPNRDTVALWHEKGLECLVNGHTRLQQHFHPRLRIVVDGRDEMIPANTGVLASCMSEVHTHDTTGTLHIESAAGDKLFYLKDFFTIYGQPLERLGYSVTVTADGRPAPELGDLLLKDGREIVVEYKR